jgi:hypothetical protein
MDRDQCGAEVEVEVALDEPPEADSVAHQSVVAQSGGELGEFSEELVVKLESMIMP